MTTFDDLSVLSLLFNDGSVRKSLLVPSTRMIEAGLRFDGFVHDEDVDPNTATKEELEGAAFTVTIQFYIPIEGLKPTGATDVMELMEPHMIIVPDDLAEEMGARIDKSFFGYNEHDLEDEK